MFKYVLHEEFENSKKKHFKYSNRELSKKAKEDLLEETYNSFFGDSEEDICEKVNEFIYNSFSYFQNTLHDHIAYSDVTDSRFDPAELAFCLEGMLLCRPYSVEMTVISKTMDILQKTQQHDAYWRPTKALFVSAVGSSLFPVSVEVANSLLRSCSLISKSDEHKPGFCKKYITIFHRYHTWIQSRIVRFTIPKRIRIAGWHSDNCDDPEVIHPWETSQILEFLIAYRAMLKEHIADTMLTDLNINKSCPKREKDKKTFGKIVKKFEPVTCLGENYKIYNQISKNFIKPRKEDKTKPSGSYSMLLYGPPGTGKTAVAKNIADELGWPLITITVSDFMAGGEIEIERRAKFIFLALESQPQSVILFDEIDNFLLNRDSFRYRDQNTAFQFITPGMLTKLSDLRASEHSIMIVATNYAERIDPAIKRTGRIDAQYLLLLPDTKKRTEIVNDLIKSKFKDNNDSIPAGSIPYEYSVKVPIFLGYGDLKNSIKSLESKEIISTVDGNAMKKMIENCPPSTNLASYQSRFKNFKENQPVPKSEAPIKEFICMLALRLEANDKDLETDEKNTLLAMRKCLGDSNANIYKIIQDEMESTITKAKIKRIIKQIISNKPRFFDFMIQVK